MKCPQCGEEKEDKLQFITEDQTRVYCTSCKHVWVLGKEEESLKNKGTLHFTGVPQAKELLERLTKEYNIRAEIKIAVFAQFSAIIYDQWYEGFKAGLIADIIHKKDLYYDGKTRSQQTGTNDEHSSRNNSPRRTASVRKDSLGPSHQTGEPKERTRQIKTKVSGVEFTSPEHIKVENHIYDQAAQIIRDIKFPIDRVDYDGRRLYFASKIGIRGL